MQTEDCRSVGPLLNKILGFLDLFNRAFDRQKTLRGTSWRYQGMNLSLGLNPQVLQSDTPMSEYSRY